MGREVILTKTFEICQNPVDLSMGGGLGTHIDWCIIDVQYSSSIFTEQNGYLHWNYWSHIFLYFYLIIAYRLDQDMKPNPSVIHNNCCLSKRWAVFIKIALDDLWTCQTFWYPVVFCKKSGCVLYAFNGWYYFMTTAIYRIYMKFHYKPWKKDDEM